MPLAQVDEQISVHALIDNPYPIYKRLRSEAPVLKVSSVNRILLTKAKHTGAVKDNPALFSSDDPTTPMQKAFEAHTLMRKDGKAHMRERLAITPTFTPKNLKTIWGPLYEKIASDYMDRLPRDQVVDLFTAFSGPLAARILTELMGIPDATDEQMQDWSQALIDGAGNFGWFDEPFERVAKANVEMNRVIERNAERLKAEPDQSALSVMVNAEDPIPWSQIVANIKIAIGGGINEPRDAVNTIIYGLLTNPDQLEELKRTGDWGAAFEEGVRWVAPIQASSRLATEDTQIGGIDIPKGEVVMTIQATANRDEDLFEEGEKFNVFRKKVPHQSFGSGPHHCLGTHLARLMIGKTLLPMLFERFPNMTLEDPEKVVWKGFGFRGPLNMPVRLN